MSISGQCLCTYGRQYTFVTSYEYEQTIQVQDMTGVLVGVGDLVDKFVIPGRVD